MADSAEGQPTDPQVTFKVKTSGDKQHTITMAETATVSDLKTKLAGPDFEDIPVERQRLIYSGRVMKNDEALSTYKIKSGNTVHLVKSAASNPAPAPSASSASAPAAPQVPTNMAAGTANNPLAGLTGARYAGLTNLPSADMFGPDGGMVGSMMDEDQLANMMSNPNVAQQMNEMMNNDAFLDMMIQQNPMLRNNPNAREMVRSPMFRHMMTNPDALRSAARLQRMMRGGGGGSQFPMPGVTDNTPGEGAAAAGTGTAGAGGANTSGQGAGGLGGLGLGLGQGSNPWDPAGWASAGAGGGGNAAANPFAGFFPSFPPPMGQPAGQGSTGATQTPAGSTATPAAADGNAAAGNAQGAPQNPPPNPFASLFGGMNPGAGAGAGVGGGAGANPFGMPPMSPEALQQMVQLLGMGSPSGSPAPPADSRPPEERYAEQLRQLNEMGFYDFDRNVAALRRSGGSVQGAIEHLLSS
ncbi:ubiquitin-domain-containing protein [Xylariaceae sp. FL0804]|nr:ubiquitin-domain-containing protein [Xylariaceae sp. FL0804]